MVAKPTQKTETWISLTLFFLLIAGYVYFLPRWQDPNQNSRIDMVLAVVDDGTFQIDRYVHNTVDYAKVGEHYYSDKAPGTAFLGIPVYAALKAVLALPVMDGLMERLNNNEALKATLRKDGSGLLEDKVRFAIAQVALTFAAAALPTAATGVLMYLLLRAFTPDAWKRALVVIGYGLLTPAFAYAGAFYGHQLAAACLFGAFYLLFPRSGSQSGGLSRWALLGAGFLMGYSVLTEYPSALVVAALVIYALVRLGRKNWLRILWLILPGLLLGVALMLYNRAVFGSFFDLGYGHSELWVEEHSQGFMSLTLPHPAAMWGVTFGLWRGLFVLSPLLLLSIPGYVLWWRSRALRAEWWVSLAAVLAFFYFNISSGMWWGGWSVGPRYMLPMLPFLALPLIFVFTRWGGRAWLRGLAALLYLASWVLTWGLTLAEQSYPPEKFHNPLFEYALPNWQVGNIARNLGMFAGFKGLSSLLPLLAVMAVLLLTLGLLARRAGKTRAAQPVESQPVSS